MPATSTTEPTIPTVVVPLIRGSETINTVKALSLPKAKAKAVVWVDKSILERIGAVDFSDLVVTISAGKFDGKVDDLGVAVSGLPEPTPEPEADTPKADEPKPKAAPKAKAA